MVQAIQHAEMAKAHGNASIKHLEKCYRTRQNGTCSYCQQAWFTPAAQLYSLARRSVSAHSCENFAIEPLRASLFFLEGYLFENQKNITANTVDSTVSLGF